MIRALLRAAHKRRMAVKRDRKIDFTPGREAKETEPVSNFMMWWKPGNKYCDDEAGKRISYGSAGYLRFAIGKRPTEQQRAQIIELYEKGQQKKAEAVANADFSTGKRQGTAA